MLFILFVNLSQIVYLQKNTESKKRILSLFLKSSRMQLPNPDLSSKMRQNFFRVQGCIMQRNIKMTNRLRRIALISVIGLIGLTTPGCLMIGVGGKDSNVRDRVAVLESRLDNLERLYATDQMQQPYCQ